ncbi:hypothetical protein GS909_21370 [Rhodococcus hoagii]|nr:hypothetical protein [Prescottella equi]
MADVDTLGPHQASGPSPGHGRLPADLTIFVVAATNSLRFVARSPNAVS